MMKPCEIHQTVGVITEISLVPTKPWEIYGAPWATGTNAQHHEAILCDLAGDLMEI